MQPVNQQGSSLLEGLIAILIFSFGMMGIASYQLLVTKQTANVQYRIEASNLINSAMGEIEADPDKINCYKNVNSCSNSSANLWYEKAAGLPGKIAPSITTNANGYTVITVFWSLPGEKTSAGKPVIHSVKGLVSSITEL